MNAFTMWEAQIVFRNGWFIHMDGKGNNSIISHERARVLEMEYQKYQASMDVDRGGIPQEKAYPGRGFIQKGGQYVYETFTIDQLIVGSVAAVGSCLTIPTQLNEITINCIAKKAFQYNTAMKKVILHDGVKEIGESAFLGCRNLAEIYIPHDHVIIKEDAFKDTALLNGDTVYLNKTLSKVSPGYQGIFQIKDGTTAIADNAFKDCIGITEVLFPESLISIGKHAFSGCLGLKEVTLPQSLEEMDHFAFANCTGLEVIRFPATMKRIGSGAFESCIKLTGVALPEGIGEIPYTLFSKCENLHTVNIPQSVTTIRSDAFRDCGFFKAYEKNNQKTLYMDNWLIHYKWKELISLNVYGGAVGIADMNWTTPKKLASVKLPDTLKYIGFEAFDSAPLVSLVLPQGLLHINTAAFRGTKLKSIFIPKSVTQIEQWAFMNCEKMETITIEGKDTEIIWPAITGRKDKKEICICAPKNSKAQAYCEKYGVKYNLVFSEYKS